MTSLLTTIKQVPSEGGNFVTLSDVVSGNYIKTFFDDGNRAGTGSFSNATWPTTVPGNALASPGAVLRDMGKTVVSSGRTFRRVQYIVPGNNEGNANQNLRTFGVGGSADGAQSGYYTGYIELGLGGGSPAPVARV